MVVVGDWWSWLRLLWWWCCSTAAGDDEYDDSVRIAVLVRMGGTLDPCPPNEGLPGIGSGHARVRRILVGLLVLAALVAILGFFLVRRSFPQVDGDVAVAGITGDVEIVRDDDGVPHIYAGTEHDLFFAQGYVHAQDRFWQMDFWRHIGAGRLSEMFGDSQVDTDLFLRSLDFTGIAEQELEMLDSSQRAILDAYAEGVNAYIESHSPSQISLEYAILPLQASGYEIEPWTPVNTLTWAKVMSWDLSWNMLQEIDRAVLSAGLPVERVEQLYPDYPEDHPVIVSADQAIAAHDPPTTIPAAALSALAASGERAKDVWDLTGGGFSGIGSNNWVVGGSHTESGLPVLANDPHLAIQMPSIWYQHGLHCTETTDDCPYQLMGFSFPGTPGVVIGHNEHIAWGVTNQSVDTQDLFIEKVNPDNPAQYEYQGQWVDMEVRPETIVVAGGDDIEYDVMVTRHGPVISDTYFDEPPFAGSELDVPDDYVVSLSWQTLQPSTLVEAIIGLNLATGYEEFRTALSKWDVAAQNVVYADTEGNIAYQATGEAPIRADGDGAWPVEGWTGENEWAGVVPSTTCLASSTRPGITSQPPTTRCSRPGCAIPLDRFGLRIPGGPNRGDDRGHTIRVLGRLGTGDPDRRPGRRGAQPHPASPRHRVGRRRGDVDEGSDRAVVNRPQRLSGRAGLTRMRRLSGSLDPSSSARLPRRDPGGLLARGREPLVRGGPRLARDPRRPVLGRHPDRRDRGP